ncbi:hypothetical protein L3Y34_014049 [Caenorhabditis briggsae]|uniref:UDP-glucuronosyltransferase n=1 Tax=Caenorhabditis briggsae TaxID=6238 RepID=A0AAE9IWZ7_CAEBR|nr:hypothetical protein L3Y34_014049 [Caenorhabditis briggsae]
MARLADTLTESGHNVTFFTPIIDETRKNQLGVKLTKNVIKLEQDSKMKEKDVKIDDMMSIFWTMDVTSKNGHRILETLHQQAVLTCDNLFRSKEIIEKLRENQYDIGLAEPLMTCGLALFRHLNIEKTIITSSCVNYDILLPTLGEPVDTSYWPTMNSQVTEKMDFSDRLENFEMLNLMLKTFGSMFDDEAKTYRSHLGPNFPDWKTLIPEASLHFSQPNCTFIWKYESDDVEFAESVENLEFVKWAPQMELLKDSRMTAFLTHGGLGSTNEAAFFGIPTIMIPIFADQSRSVRSHKCLPTV